MINQEKLEQIINRYLEHIKQTGVDRHVNVEEGYKFKFVERFQKNFDIEEKDLGGMLDTAIEDNNLVIGSHYFPKNTLLIFAEEEQEATRSALRNLFDESKDIVVRINEFVRTLDEFVEKRNKRNNRKDSSFIWVRFISLLLASKYPDKYYGIKPAEYKVFNKFLDSEFRIKPHAPEGEKYKTYERYADKIRSYIKENKDIQLIHDKLTEGLDFKDKEYRWMTQDVIFVSARLLQEKRQPDKSETPSQEEVKEIESESKSKEIEYYDFLRNFSFDNIPISSPHSLGDPQRTTIRQIINKCEEAAWLLPRFQRYYDWSRSDVRDLWKSIVNDYYVGSFLLWETGREPALALQPIEGVDARTDERNTEMIIIDGQQRMTSLYYAIRSPEFSRLKGSRFPLYFYINFQSYFQRSFSQGEVVEMLARKLSKKEAFDKLFFPLFELEDYMTWVREFKDYVKSKIKERRLSPVEENEFLDKIDKLRDHIQDKLKHIWDGFEIPFISLPETMELYEVSDIFEKINTKGKILSIFDLLIARLYKYDIELKELWDTTLEKYPLIKRYYDKVDKLPIYLFQALTLLHEKNSSCKKKDVLNIYPNIYKNTERKFEEDWQSISEWMSNAIEKMENMRDGFGVKDEKSVPFAPMIPILAALLADIDRRTNKADCYKKIRRWYWSAIFTNSYSSSVDTQLTSDFKELRKWFENDNEKPKPVQQILKILSTDYLNFSEVQKASSAQYRGVLSLIALEGARDFDTSQTLENARGNDKDHIFPQSTKLKNIESILNITWMSEETNRKIKKAKKPSTYINEFIRDKYNGDERAFQEVLKTHFIDRAAFDFMSQDQFEAFINKREKLIIEKIKQVVSDM